MQNLIITGQTSSGKTNFALDLASQLPQVALIIADSRQLYQELPILSGLDLPVTMPPNINLFGPGLFSTSNPANISVFAHRASKFIALQNAQNIPVIVVGGSGLYLDSLTFTSPATAFPPVTYLRDILVSDSVPVLQHRLKSVSPDRYESLNHSDLHNPRRLIRQLELAYSGIDSHKTITSSFHWIGFKVDIDTLRDRVRARIISRLEAGVLSEVKSLLPTLGSSHPLLQTLGAPEIVAYLQEQISYDDLIELWLTSELQYAKRQRTWFQRKPHIVWYDQDIDKKMLANSLITTINSQ